MLHAHVFASLLAIASAGAFVEPAVVNGIPKEEGRSTS